MDAGLSNDIAVLRMQSEPPTTRSAFQAELNGGQAYPTQFGWTASPAVNVSCHLLDAEVSVFE